MPTVPSAFVPQVGPQGEGSMVPLQAPAVQPFENATPRQLMEFGQAETRAGLTAYRAGVALQDELDEAATKEADTRFLATAQDIMRGKNGYLTAVGKDADLRLGEAQAALTDAMKSASDGLGNDTQRRMFQQVATRNMLQLQGQMLDHRNTQIKNYAVKESLSRADTYSDQAILSSTEIGKTEDPQANQVAWKSFGVNLDIAMQEVNKAADLLGLPQDSDQRKAMVQQLADKVGVGVVADLVQRKKFADAEHYAQNSDLSPAIKDKLIGSIESNRERSVVAELTRSVIDKGILFAPSNTEDYRGLAGDARSAATDPRNQQMAPVTDLKEALSIAAQIEDPVMRRVVTSNVRQEFGERESMKRQQYAELINSAENHMASGGTVYNMPQYLFDQLEAKDKARYFQEQRKSDEVGVMEELARNPGLLTQDYLLENRNRLTPQTYVELLKKANDPAKIIEATADAQLLNSTLVNAGLNNLAFPSSTADKTASLLLRNNVETMIDLAQQRKGGKLTREEQQGVIDGVIRETAIVDSPWYSWSNDYEKPIAAMSQDELGRAYVPVNKELIPLAFARQARIQLQKAGLASPSDTDIYQYWVKKGKPSG
jgi:hypothetical protein